MIEELHRNLKLYFPSIEEESLRLRCCSPVELVVELEDGSQVSYNDIDKTIRRLPQDPDNLTEEECRREFGARLQMMLYRKGMSQRRLSDLTGILPVSISRYISGSSTPSFYTVDKIAKALNCSVDEFRYY
jgi:DNA-binding Xre family transcriptional regulator